mmetsp:Transcript_42241/g.40462  ORF Transcript_42241/g.40462 Transcript_42241/m.40462 type:complete len:155 (-) Transcript_42241:261-725(-)
MSRYKLLKYGHQKDNDERQNWQLIDAELRMALERYNEIKAPHRDQPIFMDLIIKIYICRAYANLKSRKILTAEKILTSAKTLISFVDQARVYFEQSWRPQVEIIPLDILKQKYLLNKGYLMIALNKDQDACKHFTQCMRTGEVFDVRIRRECVT